MVLSVHACFTGHLTHRFTSLLAVRSALTRLWTNLSKLSAVALTDCLQPCEVPNTLPSSVFVCPSLRLSIYVCVCLSVSGPTERVPLPQTSPGILAGRHPLFALEERPHQSLHWTSSREEAGRGAESAPQLSPSAPGSRLPTAPCTLMRSSQLRYSAL